MILRARVSSVEAAGIRLILIDRGDEVTPPVQPAAYVGLLEIGDTVAVIFFSSSFSDGLIIAKYQEGGS